MYQNDDTEGSGLGQSGSVPNASPPRAFDTSITRQNENGGQSDRKRNRRALAADDGALDDILGQSTFCSVSHLINTFFIFVCVALQI
jgi:hypothetical protein